MSPIPAGALANEIAKPPLLSVDDVKNLDAARVVELFAEHLNPGQLHFMRLLGFHKVIVERAEGMYYVERGRPEDSRLLRRLRIARPSATTTPASWRRAEKFQEDKPPRDRDGISCRSTHLALAHNLSLRFRRVHLDMVFLGSTGSEAMEAALKVAEQAQGPERSRMIYAENSFHGKTKGALSVTDGALYRSQFQAAVGRGEGAGSAISRPYVDAIEADRSIGIVVLETIQGGGGIVGAPQSFLAGAAGPVRQASASSGSPTKCSAAWAAPGDSSPSSTTGVVPDVTALAKSLGGGKSARWPR